MAASCSSRSRAAHADDRRAVDEPAISIVDDDESIRSALLALMRSLAFKATAHESAEAMLASGEPHTADCIITDIQMPGMDGFGLIHALRAMGSDVPVIMITGRTEDRLRERAISSGAFCFLHKPFQTDTLIDCLQRALN